MSSTNWTIESSTTLRPREAAPGFLEATVFHGGEVLLDPFLALTDFHMTQPTFAPHPHAGFSAVTYMFRDSAGSFRNRDSLGDQSLIGPGALHWTQAGSGMMHEEIPVVPGLDCHGLQLFVNLRSSHKLASPQAFHVDAEDVPAFEPAPGAVVKVVAGATGGVASPIEGLLTEVLLLDVELAPTSFVDLSIPMTHRVVVLVLDGTVHVGEHQLPGLTVASLRGESPALSIAAGDAGATLLVLAGEPIEERVVFSGPFCMNSQAQIDEARRRFAAGDMGRLSPSF